MDQLTQFWIYELFSIGEFTLTAGSLISVVLVLLGTWLLIRLSGKMIKNSKRFDDRDGLKKRALSLIKIILWITGISVSFRLLGLSMRKFLETEIPVPGIKEITILTVVVVAAIIILARLAVWYTERVFNRLGDSKRIPMDSGRRVAIYQIFKYLIYLLAVLLILSNLNVNLSALLVSSAAIFVGLGLALQQTFADIASGIIILFDGTIEVGDMVYVNTLQLEGKVIEIKLRTSIIETLDSVSVVVPNSKFTSTNVVNLSYNDRETRFRVKVGVAYGSNVQLVRKVMRECGASHGKVLKKPEPRVRFVDFGESSLDFELLFWTIHVMEHEDIKSDLRFKIDAEFRRHNITIPFPQRDLHIISDFRHKPENPADNNTVAGEDSPSG